MLIKAFKASHSGAKELINEGDALFTLMENQKTTKKVDFLGVANI